MLKKRTILDAVSRRLPDHEIIVITGMRQVGKTSLLRLILDSLAGRQTLSFDLEDFHYLNICNKGPDALVSYLKLQGVNFDQPVYVAVDEIQYLANPSNLLKLLHDHYPSLKLIVSGSSSLGIKAKFKDSLAGRKAVFELDPLSLEEFLFFKDERIAGVKRNIGNLPDVLGGKAIVTAGLVHHQFETYLNEYLIYGGYPGVTLKDSDETKQGLLRDIHTSYVRKDIKDIATVDDIYGFNRLLQLLAGQVGNLVNIRELSASVGLSVNTVNKYLFLLENTFILTLLRPYHTNKRKELTRMPKIYFTDVGLRNTVLGDYRIRPQDEGPLLENFVFSELKKRFIPNESLFFWRTTNGAEVDFVVKHENGMIPIEVKAGAMAKPAVSRSLRSYVEAFRPPLAVVVNKSLSGTMDVNGVKVVFVPAYAL
jgi:predicted AAA+ superfamily ATPase